MNDERDFQILQVGAAVPRKDAAAKVTGREQYAADIYGDNLLWACAKRAGMPHARIRNIRTEAAEHLSDVVAVLTYRDITGSNRQGVIQKDQPVLADDKIRHCGDAVALIIARNRETLAKAAALVELDVEPLPALLDITAAMQETAPRVHETHPGGNILLKGDIETGKGADAFADCEAVAEVDIELPWQEHAYLETECGVAVLHDTGELEITASTQTPFRDKMEVAVALGLEPENVRVIAPFCGGAFGGKDGITVQSLLGLAALHCPGRIVKMVWEREESFTAGAKRHPARLQYRLGGLKDGALHAIDARLYFDTGAYDHLGGVVMALALEHAGGPYRIPNARLRAWSVYTNNPLSGAFRGFGVPQAAAAVEQAVDVLALKLGISPLEIRRKNALQKGDKSPVGVTMLTSTGMVECLQTAADIPLWKHRDAWKAAASSFKRRGVGIAAVMHGMGYGAVVPDVASAKIELTREGRFRIYAGVVDMGQGNTSTYLQIAGDLLNQNSGGMELVLPDTARTLPSGSSSASRTTYTFGNALISAVKILKERILQKAADLMMAESPDQLALIPAGIRHLPSGRTVPLSDMPRYLDDTERFAVSRFRAPVCREALNIGGELRLHGFPHIVFSYSAHIAGVEVDELTGGVSVLDYSAVSDCGRILNPRLFTQQIHGGVAQGIGYALFEDFKVRDGHVQTRNLSTYILPTALDIPDIRSVSVALEEYTGPFGLKGAGEIAIDAPLPAIANAVADACGIRLRRFPMTGERVLEAMSERSAPDGSTGKEPLP